MKSSTTAALPSSRRATSDVRSQAAPGISCQAPVSRTLKDHAARRYADIVAEALAAIKAQPAIRRRKVRSIREQIRQGSYSPTAAAIARCLLGS